MGLITRLKKAFQHKLHSSADNILFECTGFCFFWRGGGGLTDYTKSLFLSFHAP